MINILSYLGMNLQSEVCLWTILGLVRTIFDATLFKVNDNLKQVWQMSMPAELSLSVQRGLRTMISSIMLVQCFTVYVYLASYIVLLYPVFLEERPTLVLPWLLLAAIRKLLCELTSLALGLGTCVLLGPARPPCIKFVVMKVIFIMPTFYMWMLLYSYYNTLKVASVFKTFTAGLPPSELDYGLELAVRRRRTKSLLGEEQLRRRLISNCYNNLRIASPDILRPMPDYSSRMSHAMDTCTENVTEDLNVLQPRSNHSNRIISDIPNCFEDWLCPEVVVPRDTDRILEQFGIMMLQISAYITKEGININNPPMFSPPEFTEHRQNTLNCTAMPPDNTDTPPLVGSSNARTASYLRDYPHIFMKKPDIALPLGHESNVGRQTQLNTPSKEENGIKLYHKGSHSISSNVSISFDTETPICSKKTVNEPKENLLQNKSSEKSVTFAKNKNIRENSSDTDKPKFNNKNLPSSKDSLQTVIDEINKRRSVSGRSLKKDEIKYEAKRTAASSINVNQLQLNFSSTTSLEESDDSHAADKASSTKLPKKKLKENKQKKK